MILGPKKLLQLVKTKKLVEGLSDRELTNPEGAGFDLRIGEVYKISGKAFLGITERHTADISLVAKYQSQKSKVKSQKITIKPGEFYLTKTIENVNMPDNLTASITPRSTTYRSGLMIRTGNVPPGYCGGLIFGLLNAGQAEVTIEMGARFVHIQFSEVDGKGNMYRGQWQGGRVTTSRRERQV
ncbi:MAG: 2'-deoxycytidine 5'-triphosphate deaminase [Patescibacteria group bacterium]|nr:2'-deoxycytidine 5'-triphosphate deaminase [Patescibacteria group bacterium]